MVTDGIMAAVDMSINMFKTKEEKRAGSIIFDMLGDFDEDEWLRMTDEQKKKWVNSYYTKSN